METSYLIAKILTVIYLSFGIGLLVNSQYYHDAVQRFLSDKVYLFLGGWIAATLGTIMVNIHNIWVNDWRILITLVSWIVLVKGVLLLAFPSFIKVFDTWYTPRGMRNYILPMVIILGFIFGYYGFFG